MPRTLLVDGMPIDAIDKALAELPLLAVDSSTLDGASCSPPRSRARFGLLCGEQGALPTSG